MSKNIQSRAQCQEFGRLLWDQNVDAEDEEVDEFDLEMAQEMNSRVLKAERASGLQQMEANEATSSSGQGPDKYDNIYFDSDDEETEDMKDAPFNPRIVQSNDDLLYDPEADESDQQWADSVRDSYVNQGKQRWDKYILSTQILMY